MKSLLNSWRGILEQMPDSIALRTWEGDLTFSMFEERSIRLAARLQRFRGANALIALPFQFDYFIALHACMRSQVAAFPIDIFTPQEMLATQVRRLSITCIITCDAVPVMNLYGAYEILNISETVDVGLSVMESDAEQEGLVALLDKPLVGLFTSGSSGQQSLVTIGHLSMAYDVQHIPKIFGIMKGDDFCSVGSHASAMQIYAFWRALLNGITFIPIDPKVEGLLRSRDRLLAAQPKILRGHSTLIGEILEACRPLGRLSHTSRLFLGGEPLKSSRLKTYLDLLPSIEGITHYYSSTETLMVAVYSDRPEQFLQMERIPVGYPTPGKEVWIIDEFGMQVPRGESGEIVVRSAFICSDIQGRDAHFRLEQDDSAGVRVYHTRDLGRIREDGMLEHLGRLDRQMKINGVRVDPFFVEQCIESHGGVETCIVLAVEKGLRQVLVAAYVSQKDLDTESLRRHLESLLPLSQQPSLFIRIASVPLTERGKPALIEIDRMVREQMSVADQAKGVNGFAHRSEVGTFLLKTWSELFPGMEVDEKKSVFEQGADSLLILKLVFRINERYATSLTISDIYVDSRLESMAARIEAECDKGDTGLRLSDLPALQSGERVPMSWAQRRMWILQCLLSRPSSYHNVHLIGIPTGRTPIEVKDMLQSMAERHGILRTRLWEEDGGFWQEELPVADWELDWGELEGSSQEELGALFSAERDRPFDLSKGVLWRARWIRSPGSGDRLLLLFHHAMTDEWSTNLFLRELGRIMSGSLKPSELPRPAYSYADFARWQHWVFSKGFRDRLESYWRHRLSGLGDPVVLEADHNVPDGSFGRSGRVSMDLGSPMQSLMEDYCRGEGLSRFSVWMAVWQVLQRRLGKGEEVVLSTPVSERNQSEWQEVLGMFLNTLPIRVRVDEGASFRDFSNANHRLLAGDLFHGGLPYEDIVRVADGDLGFKGHGLPQVMFVLHGNLESDREDGDELALTDSQYAKNPVSLHLRERDGSCRITLRYDADMFLKETSEKLILRFESVARQVLANPDMRIGDINILLPGEFERLYALSGKDNVLQYPDKTLHAIFRETAERYPDRPAVIEAEGRGTSYQELQTQVDQIACFLRSQGVARDIVVAVYMQRSSLLVAALFGILEAGGAFMLLEPSLPMDRLRTMAEQSRVFLILTEEGLPVLSGFEGKSHRTGDILSEGSTLSSDPHKASDPSSLAYVIFTSGSTGVPKGAMVEHRHIINRLSYTRDALGFSTSDRALQKSPFSFDVCLTELLLPMFNGGAIVLADPVSGINLQRIVELVVRHNVTYLHFAPPVLKAFLETPEVRKVNGILRMIRCGGESLPDPVMKTCLATLDARLYQSYGPAETAVAVTLWECYNDHGHPKPPIGRPNANVDILIMDPHGRLVPPGMPGELWIGGAQTGRGYINNGEETAKRFVDDPFKHGSGRRYYRTGDLARFLSDGNLLFLGRMDDQLKVRGARIELGDVVSALLRCEGVREAVVLAEPDGEGSNRLRGWVTAAEGYSLQESGIRTELFGLLPGYMIPFRIHVITSLPVTPHGKTDHKALRAHPVCQEDEPGGIPLKTPTERWLASLWTQWLGIEVSHGDSDFFRLGGHSLMLMRLMGMIRKTFGISLDMKALFQHSLLHEIAGLIDAGGGAKNETAEIEFSPMPLSQTDSAIKLYVMIGGHGLLSGFTKYKILAEKQAWPINVSALPDPEVNAGSLPRITLKDLTIGYAEAILAEHTEGPIMLMGECFGGIDAHAIACHLQDRTSAPIHVIMLDTIYLPGMKRSNPPDFIRPGGQKTLRKGFLGLLGIFRTQKNRPLQPEDNRQIQDMAKEALRLKLFDPDWYLAENKDVADAALDPVFHYLNAGSKEGRSPSPWFSAETYEMLLPGFREITPDPIRHFLRFGLQDAVLRNPILKLAEEWMSLLSGNVPFELFDEKWYRTNNRDLLNLQTNSLIHYTTQGWRERRRPSAHFSQWLYAAICPYFDPGTQNPVLHYLLMGRFDPGVETPMQQLHLTNEDRQRITSAGWFDAIWYANSYASVLHYGREPLSHYMTVGWKMCRKPFEAFDEKIFTDRFPDYRPGLVSPLRYLLQLDKIPLNEANWEQNQSGTGKPTIPDAQETDKEVNVRKPIHHVSDILAGNGPGQPDVITDILPEGFDEKEGSGLFSEARSILRRDYEPSPFRGTIHVMTSQVLQAVCLHLGWAETKATDVRTYSLAGDHESYLFWEDVAVNGKRILGLIQDILAADLKNQPCGDEH